MAYAVTARNFSQASDNRIHSDDIARRYGFAAALVPGVAVFGHLTQPLVVARGAAWLGGSVSNLRLAQPAYDGDALQIELSEVHDQQAPSWPSVTFAQRTCALGRGAQLATLDTVIPDRMPEPLDQRGFAAPTKADGQPLMDWDNVQPGEPFRPWTWRVDAAGNQTYCEQIADEQPIYRHYAHPHWLLSIANTALMHEYEMPAWLHVGSELCLRSAIHIGDDIRVQALPLKKWERKGHQFITLYLTYHRGSELTTEIVHTAIFSVAT